MVQRQCSEGGDDLTAVPPPPPPQMSLTPLHALPLSLSPARSLSLPAPSPSLSHRHGGMPQNPIIFHKLDVVSEYRWSPWAKVAVVTPHSFTHYGAAQVYMRPAADKVSADYLCPPYPRYGLQVSLLFLDQAVQTGSSGNRAGH